MLPEAVAGEVLFLRGSSVRSGDVAAEDPAEAARELVLLDPQFASGLLTLVRPDTDAELAAYVAFARELDDGEAMALARAHCRGGQLATDDRKALRLADEVGVSALTTSGLVKRWVDALGPSAAEISAALLAIRDRARFVPAGRDPLCSWWIERMQM